MQLRLYQLGYYSGDFSGVFDDESLHALNNFQRANGIAATIAADPATLEALFSNEAVSKEKYLAECVKTDSVTTELSPGSNGKNVKKLQQYLSAAGYYSGEIDGKYESSTRDAVAAFQSANSLEATGVADSITLSRLLSPLAVPCQTSKNLGTLAYGDSGTEVKKLQRLLKDAGYYDSSLSGVFGRETLKAVIDFQNRNSLVPDGVWTSGMTASVLTGMALNKNESLANERGDILSYGDEGYQVAELERELYKAGYFNAGADEVYDTKTARAVRIFQEANGLEATGTADFQTLEKLRSDGVTDYRFFETDRKSCTLSLYESGYGVYLLTGRLRELGYPVEHIWDYDETVQEAVKLFQKMSGMDASGCADEQTRRLMNSPSAPKYDGSQGRYLVYASAAESTVGKPYEAGKTGPDSFGIGGLAYYCCAVAGVSIAPTVSMQLENAVSSPQFAYDTEDLNGAQQWFFKLEEAYITAVYIGDGIFIYASPEAGCVVSTDMETMLSDYEFVGRIKYFDYN
ncbi:MAG: peptidoglycan-binding protein [Clostridia bacterium]|nr:peptidoglycan-binding protein [Clostridia bacterium]